MRLPIPCLLVAAASTASADQVVLKSGGTLSGVLVSRTAVAVTLEVGAGRVSVPASRVERVIEGASPLGEYRDRALGLREDDSAAWLALGLWAQRQGLHTQAREAFLWVLATEPSNGSAQQALGNVRLGERWVSPEDAQRARGYVWFEGSWVPREERAFLVRERATRARVEAAERARAEAEARAREAEARVRAAEVTTPTSSSEFEGYPLGWALAGGGCCGGGYFPGHPPPHVRPVEPPRPPPPAPPAQPPARSSWTTPRPKSSQR